MQTQRETPESQVFKKFFISKIPHPDDTISDIAIIRFFINACLDSGIYPIIKLVHKALTSPNYVFWKDVDHYYRYFTRENFQPDDDKPNTYFYLKILLVINNFFSNNDLLANGNNILTWEHLFLPDAVVQSLVNTEESRKHISDIVQKDLLVPQKTQKPSSSRNDLHFKWRSYFNLTEFDISKKNCEAISFLTDYISPGQFHNLSEDIQDLLAKKIQEHLFALKTNRHIKFPFFEFIDINTQPTLDESYDPESRRALRDNFIPKVLKLDLADWEIICTPMPHAEKLQRLPISCRREVMQNPTQRVLGLSGVHPACRETTARQSKENNVIKQLTRLLSSSEGDYSTLIEIVYCAESEDKINQRLKIVQKIGKDNFKNLSQDAAAKIIDCSTVENAQQLFKEYQFQNIVFLKSIIESVTTSYCEFNRKCRWPFIHGRQGRQQARELNDLVQVASNFQEIIELLKNRLDSNIGNTYDHSYRSMLLNKVCDNLSISGKTFADKRDNFYQVLARLIPDIKQVLPEQKQPEPEPITDQPPTCSLL